MIATKLKGNIWVFFVCYFYYVVQLIDGPELFQFKRISSFQDDENTEYIPVEEAHEIFQNILKEDKHLFDDHIQQKLRKLKSSIYGKLKNEVNVRISIKIGGKSYYYQLGSGNKKMIIKSEWSYDFVNDSGILGTALLPRDVVSISVYVAVAGAMFHYLEKDTFVKVTPFIICGAPLFGIPKLTEYVQNTLGGQGQRNQN